MSSGYNRDWEARYLSGILAGGYTKTKRIGFVVGQNSARHSRDVVATYLGARLVDPSIQFFVYWAGGFDNTTIQTEAAKRLIDNHNCDVLITYVNPPAVQRVARDRNLTSIFSGGDGRVVVGETVLTSIVYSRAQVMIQVTEQLLMRKRNNSNADIREDYAGGIVDGAVKLAPFGAVYFDDPAVRAVVEPLLRSKTELIRSRNSTGLCGVSALGLVPTPGTDDCFSPSEILSWPYTFNNLPSQFSNISYLGLATVEMREIYVRYSDGLAIAFVLISCILIAIILALVAYVIYGSHVAHDSLHFASPPFLYVILAGALLLCIAVIISNTPTSEFCNATLWLVVLGLNIMYSAVFAKAGRLWWILRGASQLRVVKMPNRILFLALALQSMVVLIILILGTAFSPYERIYQFRATLEPLTVFVVCAPSRTLYWPIALIAFQGALGLVGLFFAFKTRNIFDKANESRENSLITFNLIFVGVVIIFLLYLVELSPSGSYAIQSIGILWIASTTVAILFVPRVYEFITGKPFHDSSFASAHRRRIGTTFSVQQGEFTTNEMENTKSSAAGGASGSSHKPKSKSKSKSGPRVQMTYSLSQSSPRDKKVSSS